VEEEEIEKKQQQRQTADTGALSQLPPLPLPLLQDQQGLDRREGARYFLRTRTAKGAQQHQR
jgi:hypothetical protein